MQLSFDPRDRNACTSVIATIAALHGSLPFDEANANGAFGSVEIRGDTDLRVARFDEGGTQAERLLEPDAPDPAEAFAGGASAEQAFAAPPLAATAPTPSPANVATSPVTAPAGTQGDGTAAPAASVTGPTAATPSAASPSNPGGVDVDANGLPWDGRIHSGPTDKKPKNADGTWRKKRGVDDATVAAVEAELRAALGAPAAAAPAPAVPVPPVAEAPAAAVPPPPPAAAAAPVPASPIPAPAAAAPAPAPAAAPPTPAPAVTASGPAVATTAPSGPASTFAELMRKITSLQAAGTLTVEGTAEISAALGISGVRDLITRPDLVPSFDALLPGQS